MNIQLLDLLNHDVKIFSLIISKVCVTRQNNILNRSLIGNFVFWKLKVEDGDNGGFHLTVVFTGGVSTGGSSRSRFLILEWRSNPA